MILKHPWQEKALLWWILFASTHEWLYSTKVRAVVKGSNTISFLVSIGDL